jgi:hypothetical protein
MPKDTGPEGHFLDLLQEYCNGPQAVALKEILSGKPYTENGKTSFRTDCLMKFLERKNFRTYTGPQIGVVLKKHGAVNKFMRDNEKGRNYWEMPVFEKDGFDGPLEVPDSITNDKPQF